VRYVYGISGNVAATIDSSGTITLGTEPGPTVGCIRAETDVFADEAGAHRLGSIDPDLRIRDAQHQIVGSVDVSGRVSDSTGRTIGKAEFPVDGAVLLLLVAQLVPEAVELPPAPPESLTTMMEEALLMAEEHSVPGVRKNYRKLTDEEVLGKPKEPF
jgi:hypothetical protein